MGWIDVEGAVLGGLRVLKKCSFGECLLVGRGLVFAGG